VRWIPNGVAPERFAPADGRPELRRALGIPPAAPVLGYVGHLRPEKNPARFLKACARVDPELGAHALILGDGPERPALEALAAHTPSLFGRVHLVGHQPDPREHYRAMDVFCLSSDTEQMPVALIEAMASSLPVVATEVGDVRAILPPEQHPYLVPVGERETAWPLAEALTALAADADLRQRLGAANRARVAAAFTFEGMVAAYREVYREALAAGGGGL
jgi:glycosyltransferase involved in cell wall biosynthesis